ncbi:MAG: hypothetical protein CML43_13820, partial [Rhodobacteraceae bacterium]|nr:hypothetical protein [Paracoccaceae bacterium]
MAAQASVDVCQLPDDDGRRRRNALPDARPPRTPAATATPARPPQRQRQRQRRAEADGSIDRCFSSLDGAAAYFQSLLTASELTLTSEALTVIQSSDLATATTASNAVDGDATQETPLTSCAITAVEAQPMWRAFLGYKRTVDSVTLWGVDVDCQDEQCPGAGATVEVSVGLFQSNATATLCGSLRLPDTGAITVQCFGAVGDEVRVRRMDSSEAQPAPLGLCEVGIRLTPPTSSAAAAAASGQSGAACGAEGHGTWQPGSCPGRCASFDTCSFCAGHEGCAWCETTGACVEAPLQDDGSVNATTCPALAAGPPSLALHPQACAAFKGGSGVTREIYLGIEGNWNVDGLLAASAFRNHHPQAVDRLLAFRSDTWNGASNYGLRVHGFYVPPRNGSYRFWVRNRQAIPAQLFFNAQGAEPGEATVIASEMSSGRRPQLRWDLSSSQASDALALEGGRRYYISSVSFVYDERYYGSQRLEVAVTPADRQGLPTDSDVIPAAALRPYAVDPCAQVDNCFGCAATANCAWCNGTCSALDDAACSAPVLEAERCPSCTEKTSCSECASTPRCEWIGYFCQRESSNPAAVREPESCPARCNTFSSCSSCVSTSRCGWCSSSQHCFDFNGYQTRFAHGDCRAWSTASFHCPACESHSSCASCVDDFECGWLANGDDPSKGTC